MNYFIIICCSFTFMGAMERRLPWVANLETLIELKDARITLLEEQVKEQTEMLELMQKDHENLKASIFSVLQKIEQMMQQQRSEFMNHQHRYNMYAENYDEEETSRRKK